MFEQSQYSEEQLMIESFIHQLSQNFDEHYFLQTTKENKFPEEFWSSLAAEGFLGIIIDENFGGSGLATPDLAVFLHNMAKQGLASLQLINQLICSDILSQFGSDQQKEQHLEKLIAGERWSYADLEHAQGRSQFDIAMTATQEGDSYQLNGSKCYAVGAKAASHIIVAARTQPLDKQNPQQGISLFLLEANSAGISYSEPHISVRVTSQREEMAATGDVFYNLTFNQVTLGAANLIGELNQGGTYINKIVSKQLLLTSLMAIGWGDRLIDKTVEYANQRVIFKDPISSYQAVQHPMVKAKTDIEMAKLLTERAADIFDTEESGEALLNYCGLAKHYACNAAYAACDVALQTHGGGGYDRSNGVISLWPIILMMRLVPLNSSVILQRYANSILQLPGTTPTPEIDKPVFDKPEDIEVEMLAALKAAYTESAEKSGGAAALMAIMMQLNMGNLAKYKSKVLSETKGALPVKLDLFRLLALHNGADVTEGPGIPRYMAEKMPAKYGLSAMAMAAVASGADGQAGVMKYLPDMMQGKLFCYCITEPNAGTNTHQVSTKAVDKGDHFLLSGQKTFISAADTAHYMAVIARVEVNGEKQAVGTFVMEAKTPGVTMTQLDIAALGDPQFTVYFDNVKLPKDALVGAKGTTGKRSTGSGISKGVFYTLNLERIMVALGAMKIGQESLERAIKKAQEEPPFGEPLGTTDSIKARIAVLKLEFEITRMALKKSTIAFDNGEDSKRVGMFANMAKYLSSRFADNAGSLALDLYGIEGLDKDRDDIGGLCQVGRVLRTVPINNEMVLNFLGENLMGLPKSYRV